MDCLAAVRLGLNWYLQSNNAASSAIPPGAGIGRLRGRGQGKRPWHCAGRAVYPGDVGAEIRVHESDSFINEVSEEVRRDQLYRFLRKWGWLIGTVLLLIVGGAAVNEWRKARAASAAAAAGDALRAAYAEPDPALRAERLLAAGAAAPSAAPIARLAAAGSLRAAGDTAGAAHALAELAGEAGVPQLYRDLAALQRVMLLGADLGASERLATLEALTAPGAAFRPLALEQRALAHIDAGDEARAQADLLALLTDPGATEALRTRAQQLLVATGAGADLPAGALPSDG